MFFEPYFTIAGLRWNKLVSKSSAKVLNYFKMYKYVTSFPKNMHLFLKNRTYFRHEKPPPEGSGPMKLQYRPRYHPSGQGWLSTRSRQMVPFVLVIGLAAAMVILLSRTTARQPSKESTYKNRVHGFIPARRCHLCCRRCCRLGCRSRCSPCAPHTPSPRHLCAPRTHLAPAAVR